MKKLVLIDGNSILNRAFYGIMGSKMLMTEDGTYTNAVYGFLAILFKILDDINPEYVAVAFDLKAPTKRHELYKEYKATRKGMPEELASQLPIIKEILQAMNITIIEKEGYEADDILGTLAKYGEKQKLEVTILTGDRDSFQLVSNHITVRIPRTKMGKTETEDYTKEKILEEYGLEPKKLIEVKGLMGDTSDNIPGVPGIGEKTALELIKKYNSIDELYQKIEKNEDDLKGKTREKIADNKELAILSRTLGTINIEVPLNIGIEQLERKDWNREKVTEIFKKLRFQRFMERFHLEEQKQEKLETPFSSKKIETEDEKQNLINAIIENKRIFYVFSTEEEKKEELIIKRKITAIHIYHEKENIVYTSNKVEDFKEIFERRDILKCGDKLKQDYILLKQMQVQPENLMFDVSIAGYILNAISGKYKMEDLAEQFLGIQIQSLITQDTKQQINLFEETEEKESNTGEIYTYCIFHLYQKLIDKLKETEQLELFQTIEMPLVEVLADMQYTGMYVNKEELKSYGEELQKKLEEMTKKIYELAETEFNINSPKQLGEVLFEKLKLPVYKKTKSGYSTDVEVLEKLKSEHPIIEYLLEYRAVTKLKSTYVDGLIPYIDNKGRIHSYFHQTVTATGRISSTEPNMQNIPTRTEMGKNLRKAFQAEKDHILVDADYSQIELRVLAHISKDKTMIEAFNHDEDIHTQAASKVFNIPVEEVTKELRSKAKAVNFGIVYGISDFGLGEQLNVSRKIAKEYIEQYLEKYKGIKHFMDNIIEIARKQGYVETLFKRKREIPELKSTNYMVRQFGNRVAMNTPIQGTAADIMKLAMIRVYELLKKEKMKSKMILQVHDELLIETVPEEKDRVYQILKDCMENVIHLEVPLKIEISEGKNWCEAK